jgi:putative ABC transport system permease protein
MNVRLLRGRLFNSADNTSGQMVAVISDSLARAMFGAEDPIGKLIEEVSPTVVIGVVGDTRYRRLDQAARPALYLSRGQVSNTLICLVVRPRADIASAAAAIREAVRAVDPALPAMNITTVREIIDASESGRRFYTVSTAAFAAVAVLLTLIGLAIIVSRAVLERTREMAIRSALGGVGSRLVMPVLAQGVAPVVVGALCGVFIALFSGPAIAPFLFGVSARDPLAIGGVAGFIVLAGAATAFVPARRVSRTQPAAVLRAD